MRWYEAIIFKKLEKDAVAVNWWNKQIIDKLKRNGYVKSLGVALKGKAKGKECVLIQPSGFDYWKKLKQDQKETRRFYVSILITILSGALGFVLGKLWP